MQRSLVFDASALGNESGATANTCDNFRETRQSTAARAVGRAALQLLSLFQPVNRPDLTSLFQVDDCSQRVLLDVRFGHWHPILFQPPLTRQANLP
jgi:hypothetical protein